MVTADTFGTEQGYGDKVVKWINERLKDKKKGEAKLNGNIIETSRFGKFEMFTWEGDPSIVRDVIVKASKRFKIKTLEGGYQPESRFSRFTFGSKDYAKVHYKGRLVGYLLLTKPRLPGGMWSVEAEKGS